MDTIFVVNFVLAGIFATAVLDLSGILLHKLFRFPTTEWRYIGRWVANMGRMKFYFGGEGSHISKMPTANGELILGWSFHYLVGIFFAFAYFAYVSIWLSGQPNLYAATLFGILTLGAPWLVMAPCLGNGFFSSRHPRRKLIRALSVLAHVTFGQCLYLWWIISPF